MNEIWRQILADFNKAKHALWCPKHCNGWTRDGETGHYYMWKAYHQARTTEPKDYLIYARILSMMASDKPDLVLLDYAMPEMDGPAVLAAIRSNPEIKDIPVVYRTGMDDSDCEGSGDVKPDGIVSKSEGRPSLMKAVEAILG